MATNTKIITQYFESNKNRILNLCEKNYEHLVEALTNNAIDSAAASSSNPTSSLPQSSSPTFSNLSDQSDPIEQNIQKAFIRIKVLQELKITAKQDIQRIEFDIAEIKVHDVSCSLINDHIMTSGSTNFKQLPCKINQESIDKLIVELEERLPEGSKVNVLIKYSAGVYFDHKDARSPRSGFHFISPDNRLSKQAWTQGEAIESRYWFPCLDDPQVKFTREVRVIAPDSNFVVISNGTSSQDGNIITSEANASLYLQYASQYYTDKVNLRKKYLKLSVSADMLFQLICIIKIRRAPTMPDTKDFRPLITKTSEILPVSIIVADKGYDSEDNHVFVREYIHAFSIIPARFKNIPIWKTRGKYRKQMKSGYPRILYHQRNKDETIMSVIKDCSVNTSLQG
jgi:Peptidase M1 N-terminal domain